MSRFFRSLAEAIPSMRAQCIEGLDGADLGRLIAPTINDRLDAERVKLRRAKAADAAAWAAEIVALGIGIGACAMAFAGRI